MRRHSAQKKDPRILKIYNGNLQVHDTQKYFWECLELDNLGGHQTSIITVKQCFFQILLMSTKGDKPPYIIMGLLSYLWSTIINLWSSTIHLWSFIIDIWSYIIQLQSPLIQFDTFLELHNWFMELHDWFMVDLWIPWFDLWISIILMELHKWLWISIIGIMEFHNSNYGAPWIIMGFWPLWHSIYCVTVAPFYAFSAYFLIGET